jgi:dihydroorotate dehydrogenase (NAD+) catalytic subunit
MSAEKKDVNLEVSIAGVRFANPVIAASGTFGYGGEYSRVIDVSRLGGICSKGLTLAPKPGNTGPRLVETPAGLINSIGLENPGIPHFIEHELKSMLGLGPVVLANLSGSTMETYVEGAALLDATDVPMIELNISCPNVKAGGMAWGLDCDAAGAITAAVRKATKKPLVVKLSPNAPHLVDVAKSVVASGADALSLVNTFQAFAVDIERARPVFDNVTAGLAGPAIRPIALRMLRDIVLGVPECDISRAKFVPVIGLGGIATWQDAVEFIMTGASAIQVGTATFANPHAMEEIIDGLAAFMARKGYADLAAMRGIATMRGLAITK